MRINCSPKGSIAVGTIFLGLLLRTVVVFLSDGSNDIRAWSDFASFVARGGVCACYSEVAACNHPPLSLLSSVGVRQVAFLSQVSFSIVFKGISLFAELITMVCLYRFLGSTTSTRKHLLLLAAYAFSPLPILITAFHGNTDAVVLAGLFLAVYLRFRDRPSFGSALVGFALNVKLIPILWVPMFLIQSVRRDRSFRDFLVCVVCLLVAAAPLFVTYFACPAFYERVVGYSVAYDRWGFIYLFSELCGFQPESKLWPYMELSYRSVGRYLSVVVALLIAVKFALRPVSDLTGAAAAVACAFLVFTPGWGIQYMIYPLPFLLVARPMLGAIYAVLGGGFTVFLYFNALTSWFPLSSCHCENLRGAVGVGGIVVWGFFVLSLVVLLFVSKRSEGHHVRSATFS
jgi:hypothetical protein